MNCDQVVSLNWSGNGSLSAYLFFKNIGLKSSQWATAPNSNSFVNDFDINNLSNLWEIVKTHLSIHKFTGLTGWPYSLLYKEWDSDEDLTTKFIFLLFNKSLN